MTSQSIIDTHTHLCDKAFDPDRDEVLARAGHAGIAAILLVSENMEDVRKNLALADANSMLKPLAGLYPSVLDSDRADAMLGFIRENRNRLWGIGEVGLDFWVVKEDSDRTIQKEIFIQFIRMAKELDLPLNVHSRSAGRHVIEILLDQNAAKVQLHAFDGKAGTALPAVEAGFFFSVPSSVVRSRQKQKLVKQLPLSCLLVETDSPVLGPVPGQRNEPKNILGVIDAIAEIKGISKEKIIDCACQNTLRLYGELLNSASSDQSRS
jgi:TatD DNase family protein